MKIILLFPAFLFFLVSCGDESKDKKENSSEEKKSDTISQNEFELDGVWVMTNYLDSILEYKTVAKYRMLPASWIAIILKIEGDSLKAYGSILDKVYAINLKNDDSLAILKEMSREYLLTINEDSRCLELKETKFNPQYPDTVIYQFKKRNDLDFLLKNMAGFHKTSDNFTTYFNKKLIAGNYELNGSKKVKFSENGTISNFQNYTSFKVRNYFGTLHPFKNLDVLYLKTTDGEEEYWNWRFENDNLILTKLFCDFKTSDDYSLTNEKIVLTKIR